MTLPLTTRYMAGSGRHERGFLSLDEEKSLIGIIAGMAPLNSHGNAKPLGPVLERSLTALQNGAHRLPDRRLLQAS